MGTEDYFVTEDDIFKNGVLSIAVFLDGLTQIELNSAFQFLQEKEIDGKIQPVIRTIHADEGNIKFGMTVKNNTISETAKILENIKIAVANEIWVFDDGYHYEFNGNLDKRLLNAEKTVRFLRRENNNNWYFYKTREIIWNEDMDDIEIRWHEMCKQKPIIVKALDNKKKNLRKFSKTTMTEREYEITYRALQLTYKASGLGEIGITRLDNTLRDEGYSLVRECNKIYFHMLENRQINDEELKVYAAQLDFIEADIEKLANANGLIENMY